MVIYYVKIKNVEHSREVQKRAFKEGWRWGGRGAEFGHERAKYLFFYQSKSITWDNNISHINLSYKEGFPWKQYKVKEVPYNEN